MEYGADKDRTQHNNIQYGEISVVVLCQVNLNNFMKFLCFFSTTKWPNKEILVSFLKTICNLFKFSSIRNVF